MALALQLIGKLILSSSQGFNHHSAKQLVFCCRLAAGFRTLCCRWLCSVTMEAAEAPLSFEGLVVLFA